MLKRFIYLAYYLKGLDFKKLGSFLNYAHTHTGISKLKLLSNAVQAVFKYNISLLEYFQFRFFERSHEERLKWAGTGFMYEYQKVQNPIDSREILENKLLFNAHFKKFILRKTSSIDELRLNDKIARELLANSSEKLVLKNSLGQVGAEVEIVSCKAFDTDSLIKYMQEKNYNLIEEFVVQHHSIMELSPSGLNTIRVFTQLQQGKVEFLGARLRVTVNCSVDNMAAGNLAAPIDMDTGIVNGPGVYSDITKEDQGIHPITGKKINGFQIPYWDEVRDMVIKGALIVPENKSIGWDVAISEKGPELIEGNHNWCKLLWQLPEKKGLKEMLNKYV
ncbi:hexapeptide transferase [Labilibacter sediminis]|nr:hexapeptide transferase [Labilibacter sediminis]